MSVDNEFVRLTLEQIEALLLKALAAQRAEIADLLDKWAEGYDYEGMVALGEAADRVRANVPSDPPATT